RRVTFNLDNVQVQTIPIYSSCSSEDSSESEQEDEDYIYSLPSCDPAVPHPLITMRSLEMTEQLIAESIEREMALNPHLLHHPAAKRTTQTRDIFFVKVLEAENLDFPIEDGNLQCVIKDIDPNEQIAITIHVAAATQNNKKMQLSNSSWYHRMKAPSDLQRYVHEKDGSICQTLFSPDRFMSNASLDQTASLMLVNNWYRAKPANPAVVAKEKAVGKLYVQCLH
ncbi:hypothetical protein BD408DRAFT_323902, partial [Parasitella parasitica]